MYHSFEIPKKDGSKRIISAPDKKLREIQRKLANLLSAVYEPKICAYGFIPYKNIVGNAAVHAKKHLVLNIDLKDFFHQIHFGRIRGMLVKEPYNIGIEAATTIAQLSCFNGRLPQGAPSSPVITNMICVPLDNALMRLAKKTGCVYTRYADDITFSTFSKEFDKSIVYVEGKTICIGNELAKILQRNSFEVNLQKISLKSRDSRQEVTGLTVNEFPNVRRSYVRQIRAIMHSCETYGILNAAKVYVKKGLCKNPTICGMINNAYAADNVTNWFKSVIIGKINFIRQIKGAQSLTYLSFAQQYNKLFDENYFDLTELHRFDIAVKDSTFILQYETKEEFIQGSAFYISGIGLFTSYHVTESGNYFKVYSVDTYPDKPLGTICKSLNEISSDSKIDYALYELKVNINDKLTFRCGDSQKIKVGDQVTIIGYPNYQKDSSAFIQPCCITSKKTYMGALFYTVSGRIVHGASGGIVLNSNYEAIGIIKAGIVSLSCEDSNENQGFVPLHLALDHYTTSCSNV